MPDELIEEAKRLICLLRGHRWNWRPLRYWNCWTCDEVCSRCGAESWWPQ